MTILMDTVQHTPFTRVRLFVMQILAKGYGVCITFGDTMWEASSTKRRQGAAREASCWSRIGL